MIGAEASQVPDDGMPNCCITGGGVEPESDVVT
jgi:hypothetical protein